MFLKLMYITNNPEVALVAEKNGVDRIFIDLETLGKDERQGHLDTVKSKHNVSDINDISNVLTTSELLVRINPWNNNSREEVDNVIATGADLIMLPMWKTVMEVKNFIQAVNGRALTVLLLETKEAAECLDEVLLCPGINEIHIGLNDLHLSYGLTFMFELLSNGTVEVLCKKIAKAGIPYGFGGIARIGEGTLPAEKIVMEHYRLGSTRVILSRSFCNADVIRDIDVINQVFSENVKKLRCFEDGLDKKEDADFEINISTIRECVESIVVKTK